MPLAAAAREQLGVADRFVVGWVGSFRPFHSLDRAVDAVAGMEGATLLLVGDGPERPAIEARARQRNVHLVCTGTVDHADLPATWPPWTWPWCWVRPTGPSTTPR